MLGLRGPSVTVACVPRHFFMGNNEKPLLQKIEDLPLSEDLKNILRKNKIIDLEQLLNIKVFNWHKNFPEFTYHHQHEIVSYMQQNNLMEYLNED